MPLHWKINSEEHLFEAVCDGLVELREVDKMLDVLVVSAALGYRKLFDASRGRANMGPPDILHIGVRIRSLHAVAPALGPLAIVAPAENAESLARLFGILAVPRRSMKVFASARKARSWLDSLALRAAAS